MNCNKALDNTDPSDVSPVAVIYELDTTCGSVDPESNDADIEPDSNSRLELVYPTKLEYVVELAQLVADMRFSTSRISSIPVFFNVYAGSFEMKASLVGYKK